MGREREKDEKKSNCIMYDGRSFYGTDGWTGRCEKCRNSAGSGGRGICKETDGFRTDTGGRGVFRPFSGKVCEKGIGGRNKKSCGSSS